MELILFYTSLYGTDFIQVYMELILYKFIWNRLYTSLYGTDFIQVYMELILYKFIWN